MICVKENNLDRFSHKNCNRNQEKTCAKVTNFQKSAPNNSDKKIEKDSDNFGIEN